MKIRIIKATKPTYWYAVYVGVVFDVDNYSDEAFVTKVDKDKAVQRHFMKDDCVVLNTENEENR